MLEVPVVIISKDDSVGFRQFGCDPHTCGGLLGGGRG